MADQPKGEITLQTIPMPRDTNGNGDIFGGWLMSHMDLAAGILARRRARGRTATVAVDAMQFLKPVKVGDVVSIYADMQRTGRTSMGIGIEVWVHRMPTDETLKVTEALFTFVAIDDNGNSRPLPGPAA